MQIRLPATDPKSAWPTIQIDEPALAGTLSEREAEEMRRAFARLRAETPNARLILTANPTAISRDSMPLAVKLPVDALYLNVFARPRLLIEALALAPAGLDLIVPEIAGQSALSSGGPTL